MAADDRTVAERLRARFEDLTRAERQLADAMLRDYPMLGLGSITALAEAAHVSSPTVVRLARKLGYGGFSDLQAALRDELQATISNPIARHDRWAEDAPAAHALNRFADVALSNMRQTISSIDPADFDAAAALLADRKRAVFVTGGRISHALADYLYTHLQVIRARVTLAPGHGATWPHHALEIRAGDVLMMFDMRRYERDLLRFAEAASEAGAQIVLITDQWGSPIAKLAAHSFHARIEAPSAWDSNVAPMVLVEALLAAVEARDWDDTRERMRRLEALFDRSRTFRKFT
ncbi:MurR/RpiR family transcriptional regulator [Oceanicella actignis]|uniref:MurR/RpiR family transcriptional regulator n=1 Tax=Oceanicella actignis TaxID=1189325 RepID=UPI0011E79D43|nr:MurR/RpiR family transcriptional regulator [Oceanicella actignis]TYO90464.1 RpiR family transcriptional regulator [Oceanicella actignis]